MKYLSKYKQFNESKKPDNFVDLNSIGSTLDPINGIIYPNYSNGDYDEDNGFQVDSDYVEYIDISDEDIKKIETYYKSTEELVKDNIDWNLISLIKDMSLDYLDNDYKLNIIVTVKTMKIPYKSQVYSEFYSHLENTRSYTRYFKGEWDRLIYINKPENYYYTIRLLKNLISNLSGRAYTDGTKFVDELRNAFPEYSDKIDYSKW